MKKALIGHTGFVGSNLSRDGDYSAYFNSTNIAEIEGNEYDLIVCAGISAVKWKANKCPESDWEGIEKLLKPLSKAKSERFILISTIDVYAKHVGVDETTAIDQVENHPYGTHRLRVEKYVEERFAKSHIIRLPGLFGPGLKKNVIYDLLHNNCLEMINLNSCFQYYDVRRLEDDMQSVIKAGLKIVNFSSEPISNMTIIDRFFPKKRFGATPSPTANYDIRSIHAEKLGGIDGYLYSAETVLEDMGDFIRGEQGIAE